LLNWSSATTVKSKVLPATIAPGAATTKCDAAAPLTVMGLLVPVTVLAASVAVTVWLPAVSKVALKVPTPLARVASAGSTAWLSLLLKWTVPL